GRLLRRVRLRVEARATQVDLIAGIVDCHDRLQRAWPEAEATELRAGLVEQAAVQVDVADRRRQAAGPIRQDRRRVGELRDRRPRLWDIPAPPDASAVALEALVELLQHALAEGCDVAGEAHHPVVDVDVRADLAGREADRQAPLGAVALDEQLPRE